MTVLICLDADRAELQRRAIEKGPGQIAASKVERTVAHRHKAVRDKYRCLNPRQIGQFLNRIWIKLQYPPPGQVHILHEVLGMARPVLLRDM